MLLNDFGEYKILYDSASLGITEIVKLLLQSCPELAWAPLGGTFDKSLLHVAIQHRQKEVFGLFYERKSNFKFATTTSYGTILHLAARLAPHAQLSSVSGSALQMQRELQWFKVLYLILFIWFRVLKKTTFSFFFLSNKKLGRSQKCGLTC